MDLFRQLWKRIPLIIILVATSLLFTLIGWSGRNTIYASQSIDLKRQPYLTLFFEGLHEGVYPWGQSASTSDEEEAGELEENKAHRGVLFHIARSQMEIILRPAQKACAQLLEERERILEELENLPENAVMGSPDEIPEGVCNPVMQAEDYGVAGVGFLSPDDTEYNTDTEGIFAKTGLYYKLQAVNMDYFDDALFIGDSRTVGLCEYGGLGDNASFLARESINVYNVQDLNLKFSDPDGDSWDSTVDEILSERKFGKIYVNLGVNELGIGTTYMYYEKYRDLLTKIREYQPDAIIYIQGIMHVSKAKSESDSCRNNTVIVQRNTAISTLANGRDIFYIDMNPYVCDESGDLIADLSGDGIHLKASAYGNWDRSLMENAVVIDSNRE